MRELVPSNVCHMLSTSNPFHLAVPDHFNFTYSLTSHLREGIAIITPLLQGLYSFFVTVSPSSFLFLSISLSITLYVSHYIFLAIDISLSLSL